MTLLQEYTNKIRKSLPATCLRLGFPTLVFIDPGHGGLLDGRYVTAPAKMYEHPDFTFYEGVYNRALAWTWAQSLYEYGYSYKMVVPDDKDVPLKERCRRANDYAEWLSKSQPSFRTYYHSIHGNAFGIQSVSGIEIYTSPGDTAADPIASIYYGELSEKMGKYDFRMRPGYNDFNEESNDPDKEARFTVLTNTHMPAILSETGFFTNEEEARKMASVNIIHAINIAFFYAHKRIQNLKW